MLPANIGDGRGARGLHNIRRSNLQSFHLALTLLSPCSHVAFPESALHCLYYCHPRKGHRADDLILGRYKEAQESGIFDLEEI